MNGTKPDERSVCKHMPMHIPAGEESCRMTIGAFAQQAVSGAT